MKIDINKERLAQVFTELCEIDSPSRSEAGVFSYLKDCFTTLGADAIMEDNSKEKTGSECNNLIVRFDATDSSDDALFFSTHMDTVKPANGVRVKRDGDVFTSAGDTILGGDDKSGIAPLIEMIHAIKESKTPHCTIELVFTTCEEIGLLGAKYLDHSLLTSTYGYALDSTGINKVIVAAPAANKLKVTVRGAAAHAGLNPSAGINALQLAAKAIAALPQGRLDDQSTSNFGVIKGGIASNIVPDLITLEGEVRSHDPEKLKRYTKEIADKFKQVIDEWSGPAELNNQYPAVELEIVADYPAMHLKDDTKVLQKVRQASEKLNIEQEFIIGGGGSDANIFNGFGLQTVILATGMDKVHTLDECIDLNDMVTVTRLLHALVTT